MRKGPVVFAIAVLAFATTRATPVAAWGFAAHRLIMNRAIDILPPELKPLFERNRAEMTVRVTDPDSWRVVGWDDGPNHFIDFGVAEYGPYPFDRLPRDYGAAVEKFGLVDLKRYGLLPWRVTEEFGYLRRLFEELPRQAPYTVSNIVLIASVSAHYVQDTYQPLHATDNFDGQLTGQGGLHDRFERDLIERYESRLRLTPAAPTPMMNARDAAFTAAIQSYTQVAPILVADKEAIAGKDSYDAQYFEAFFAKVQPLVERQLSEAITATAGMIMGAWEQAGRPALRTTEARPVQRVRPVR